MGNGPQGIPTKYQGVQMRSRIEARWAAFFDFCGWRWEYEPFDLDGWIPDFLIRGSTGELLVEVKSELRFMPEVAKKIERAAAGRELLLLGFCLNPMPIEENDESPSRNRIGWFGESHSTDEMGNPLEIPTYWWQNALLGTASGRLAKTDIGPDLGGYQGRLHGEYDGNPMYLNPPDWKVVEDFWVMAGNRVQWKGRR